MPYLPIVWEPLLYMLWKKEVTKRRSICNSGENWCKKSSKKSVGYKGYKVTRGSVLVMQLPQQFKMNWERGHVIPMLESPSSAQGFPTWAQGRNIAQGSGNFWSQVSACTEPSMNDCTDTTNEGVFIHTSGVETVPTSHFSLCYTVYIQFLSWMIFQLCDISAHARNDGDRINLNMLQFTWFIATIYKQQKMCI